LKSCSRNELVPVLLLVEFVLKSCSRVELVSVLLLVEFVPCYRILTQTQLIVTVELAKPATGL
jgi:hypothetical protein